jgi:predicted O-linked N-acetylglucosamine transferase (SPINDLY family)
MSASSDPASEATRLAGHAEALFQLGRMAECVATYRKALEIDPAGPDLLSGLIYALQFSTETTLEELLGEMRHWDERHAQVHAGSIKPHPNTREPERRLRIGYVSADFYAHAAAMSFSPAIRHHDRAAFEVYCYSGGTVEDEMTASLRQASDAWRSTGGVSDDALAARIREDRIDILVDLSGHTAGHRLPVFARKPAPIQIGGWGSVTGSGLRTTDYLFSDPVLIPAGVRHSFTEKIIDLPCCLAFDVPGDGPGLSPSPALRGHPFTFGCLNRVVKITGPTIALWTRILDALPDSRLLLKDRTLENSVIEAETLRRFSEHGIGKDRLLLLGPTSLHDHMESLRGVDLALDPFPYSGGITTALTLWMGVPVITLSGNMPVSRMSAAILAAVGMPDWIARDEDDYVRIALDFAEEPALLEGIRQEMRQRLARTAVFDGRQYARSVESAYRDVWRRWCRTAA